jgi:hypothetical protein
MDMKYDNKLKKSKTVRLSDVTVRNITYMVEETKISESELLRLMIEKYISEHKFKKALDMLKNNHSLTEAAKVAGLSYRVFFNKVIDSKVLSEKEIVKLDRDSNRDIDDILKMLE